MGLTPDNLRILTIAGGVLHFCILFASAMVPGTLNWRGELQKLPPLLRQLFWVYGAFIVLMIVGQGTLSLAFSRELAAGSPLARGVAGFIAVFWGTRLAVRLFVFDAGPYLKNAWYRLGYRALTLAFLLLTAIYAIVVLMPREVEPIWLASQGK